MNWKNILFLLRVERKSGRLLRGIKATRYRENGFLAYWPYWTAATIGVLGGLLANFIASSTYSHGIPTGLSSLNNETLNIFVVLPTIVLVLSFVLTLFQQIQLAGIKATSQVMYWLPITWQEQAAASILSNLLGFPIAFVVGLASGIIVFSVFNGLILFLQALLTTVILFAAAFTASTITEILRILQVRFVGAVYKSSGRAAIWVRFVGSIVFIVIAYVLYFYITSGFSSFLTNLSAAQTARWYVPFLWLALFLSYTVKGLFLQGFIFIGLSALLIAGLYYFAVLLNKRFGLYEPPAITIQKSGIYAPKVGLLGKLGFSTVEAALIRKDLRAFTRRRELLSIYILPIIIIIVALFDSIGTTNGGTSTTLASLTFFGLIFLLPAGGMAMMLGESLIGEEGQAVWRIYASPISTKSLVKSKYFFTVLFSIIILVVSAAVGVVFLHPSLRKTITAMVEAFFIVLVVASVSLQVGFRGADFSQTRRARMIRQEWSLIGLIVCAIAGTAVLAPVLVTYGLSSLARTSMSSINLAIGVAISAVISITISAVFYRINIGSAQELLRKAEI
ncbi:MAG: hypothetical protein ABSA75_04085 [Candidatus Bathyarchaeia archaeon]|jgi:hypothetical protein